MSNTRDKQKDQNKKRGDGARVSVHVKVYVGVCFGQCGVAFCVFGFGVLSCVMTRRAWQCP